MYDGWPKEYLKPMKNFYYVRNCFERPNQNSMFMTSLIVVFLSALMVAPAAFSCSNQGCRQRGSSRHALELSFEVPHWVFHGYVKLFGLTHFLLLLRMGRIKKGTYLPYMTYHKEQTPSFLFSSTNCIFLLKPNEENDVDIKWIKIDFEIFLPLDKSEKEPDVF